MAGRRCVSTRTRFNVFQRDDFTCRYCGRRPPDVELVIDHLVAVANGGSNEPENLVTACEPCNAGKSDLVIEEATLPPITPEAERALQESVARQRRMVALRMEARELRLRARQAFIDEWAAQFGARAEGERYLDPLVDFPSDGTVDALVERYGLDEATRAIAILADSWFKGSVRGDEAAIRYLHGILRRRQPDPQGGQS